MSNPEYESFTIRVPKPLAKRLRKVAERELSSMNRECNIALRAHLDASERRYKA